MRLLTYSALLMAVLEALIIYSYFHCLPDAQDRFFMGRGSHGQCLYAEGNAVGEVWE